MITFFFVGNFSKWFPEIISNPKKFEIFSLVDFNAIKINLGKRLIIFQGPNKWKNPPKNEIWPKGISSSSL
jgi:hypothetical protein